MRGLFVGKYFLGFFLSSSLAGVSYAQDAVSVPGACKLHFKQKNYATGNNPQSTVTGDFNKDGNADFAQVNYNGGGSGSVDVFLGNGSGKFAKTPNVYATGNGPDALATADVNGDGNLDLIVGNDTQASVSVLAGNGDGTFQASKSYNVGLYPHWVTVADFNGDGKPDIAVVNEGNDSVGVLLNKGNGTFAAMKTYPVNSEPYSVVAADFNRDGKTDLAVTGYYNSVVSILLGKGDGTFGNHKDIATGTAPAVVVTGDFDRDGKIDLATANYNNGQTGSASVLLGNGDGTFKTHLDYPAGAGPDGLAVGNFNGDKFSDLAVANLIGNSISILPGNGDGTFGAPVDFTTGNFPLGIATGQFHGNGKKEQDLVVTNDLDQTATVFLNTASHACD